MALCNGDCNISASSCGQKLSPSLEVMQQYRNNDNNDNRYDVSEGEATSAVGRCAVVGA